MSKKELSTEDVIELIRKKRKALAIYVLIILLVAIYFVTANSIKYDSTVTVYPVQHVSGSTTIMNEDNPWGKTFLAQPNEVNQIQAWAHSTQLIDHIIQRFNLYECDTALKHCKEKARRSLANDYEVFVNVYGGIELKVHNRDKYKAAEIANAMAKEIDILNRTHISERIKRAWQQQNSLLKEIEKELAVMVDTLQDTRGKYNIYDPKVGGEIISEQFINTLYDLNFSSGRLSFLQRHYASSDTMIINLKARVQGLKQKYKLLTAKGDNQSVGNFSVISKISEKILKLTYEIETLTKQPGIKPATKAPEVKWAAGARRCGRWWPRNSLMCLPETRLTARQASLE